MASEMRYIVAPIEILRGATDNPLLFVERAEGLFSHATVTERQNQNVLNEFDAMAKSKVKVIVTKKEVAFIKKICEDERVFEETKAIRVSATFGMLALKSIQGRSNNWITTNNRLFVARMAGYSRWQDFIEGEENGGIWSCYVGMNEKTMMRHCVTIKNRISAAFENAWFRPSANNRGWEFTTKNKQI